MKRKGFVRLLKPLAVVLALALAVQTFALTASATGANGGTAAKNKQPLDLTKGNTLTINPCDENNQDQDFVEDLKSVEMAYDVYLIKAAAKIPGQDAYDYQWDEIYKDYGIGGAMPEEVTNEAWQDLAQQLLAKLQSSDTKFESQITGGGEKGNVFDGLEAGLYLIVARGADLTEKDQYITEMTDDAENPQLVSVANSAKYTYSFLPQLVSLPTKEAVSGEGDEGPVISTSNPGEWLYELTANLKPSREPRYGNLQIVKEINAIEEYNGKIQPATFVFEIKAYEEPKEEGGERKLVYTNVVSISFDSGSQGYSESVTVERIPRGTTVEVTEVYSGASYVVSPGSSGTLTLEDFGIDLQQKVNPDDPDAAVTFKNDFSEHRGGHGIMNHFNFADGKWNWTTPDLVNGDTATAGLPGSGNNE